MHPCGSRRCHVPPPAVRVCTKPAALATFSAVACSKELFHWATLLLKVIKLKRSSGRRSCKIFNRASLVCSEEKTTVSISTLPEQGLELQSSKGVSLQHRSRRSPTSSFSPDDIHLTRKQQQKKHLRGLWRACLLSGKATYAVTNGG